MPYRKLAIILVGALTLLYAVTDPHILSGTAETFTRITALVATAAAVRYYTMRQHVRPTKDSHQATAFDQLPPSRAKQLQKMAGSEPHLSAAEATLFAMAVLEPAEIRQRITETYEPGQRTLAQNVTIQGHLPRRLWRPADTEHQLRIPVLIPPKGTLSDKLTLRSASGTALPALAYMEYLQTAAKVLRRLLMTAHGITRPDEKLPRDVLDIELRALERMMRRGNDEPDGDPHPADQIAALDAPRKLVVQVAAEFVRLLTGRYALVADVPMDRARFLVSYQRTIVPAVHFAGTARPNLLLRTKGWVRVLLGTRPVDITLELDNATKCKSFHVVVDCPDGLYLREQEAIDVAPAEPPPPDGRIPQYHRFRSRSGQPYAHFYARFLPKRPVGDPTPKVRFRFLEAPPGSLFRAAIAAGVCFLLVYIIAAIVPWESTEGPGMDAPAFLLAFPAIAATWLVFESPTRRLFEGTLTARLSLIGTALLSIAATALFVFYRSRIGEPPTPWPGGMSVLGVTAISWTMLAGLAFANAVVTGYKCWHHTWVYTHLCSHPRKAPEGSSASQGG